VEAIAVIRWLFADRSGFSKALIGGMVFALLGVAVIAILVHVARSIT
jgi:hypothetical protein